MPRDDVLKPDVIAARLADLPAWQHADGWITRTYRTNGWKGTLMVINTVGHLAEAAWHHPDLSVSYAFVTVKLMTHSAKGITDKDFALAHKIEEVLMWQPGTEPGAAEALRRSRGRRAAACCPCAPTWRRCRWDRTTSPTASTRTRPSWWTGWRPRC